VWSATASCPSSGLKAGRYSDVKTLATGRNDQQNQPDRIQNRTVHSPLPLTGHEASGQDTNTLKKPDGAHQQHDAGSDAKRAFH
jgi:hypothetical protein